MMLCMFSNYSVMNALKEMLLIKNLGAELFTAVKLYVVMPCGLIFMCLYIFLTSKLSLNKLFLSIMGFFLLFFVVFTFCLYPYHSSIDIAMQGEMSLYEIILKQWVVVSFYAVSDLWITAIIVFLFWQFANSTTSTDQAKTSYPIYILMSYLGSVFGVFVLQKVLSSPLSDFTFLGRAYEGSISSMLFIIIFFTALVMLCFCMLSKCVADHDSLFKSAVKDPHYGLAKSLHMVFTSKYLRTIFIIILCCSVADSILDMAWRYKARNAYSDVKEYMSFVMNTNQWVSILTLALLVGSIFILRQFNWFVGAMITPVVVMVAGLSFLIPNLAEVASDIDTSSMGSVVLSLGAISFAASKILKNSLFNATKEMAFIPESEPMRSQGRIIVIFLGKSLAGFIPALFFIVFPTAGHKSFLYYLVFVFLMVSLLWVVSVRRLGGMYQEKIS